MWVQKVYRNVDKIRNIYWHDLQTFKLYQFHPQSASIIIWQIIVIFLMQYFFRENVYGISGKKCIINCCLCIGGTRRVNYEKKRSKTYIRYTNRGSRSGLFCY